MRRQVASALGLALFPSLALADSVGSVALRLKAAHELDSSIWQTATAEATLQGSTTLGRATIHGVGLLAVDAEDSLEPGQPDDTLRSPINRRSYLGDQGEASLRELYADLSWAGIDWRLGKQQIVWGNGDGIKFLDLINPQSFREFIAAPQDESRIPLWSVFAQRQFSDAFGLDAVLVPDLTPHDIPESGALYEITSPLLSPQGAAATPPDLNSLALALDQALSAPGNQNAETIGDPLIAALLPLLGPLDTLATPITPEVLRDALAPRVEFRNERPRLRGDTLEWGLRARLRLGGLEAALITFRHFADVPLIRAEVSAEQAVVTRSLLQTRTWGLNLSHPLGRMLLRGEALYTERAPLPAVDFAGDDRRADAPQTGLLVGADRFLGERHFLSVQAGRTAFVERAGRYPAPSAQTYLSLLWRAEWGDTRDWVSECFLIASTTGGDAYLRPRLSWQASDAWSLGLGFDVFDGSANGVFGQFDARDRVLVQLQWTPW